MSFTVGERPDEVTVQQRLANLAGGYYRELVSELEKDDDLMARAIRAITLIALILYSSENMPIHLERQYGKSSKDGTFNSSVALYITVWVFTGTTTVVNSYDKLITFRDSDEYTDREMYPRMKEFLELLINFFPKLDIGGGKNKKQKETHLLERNMRHTKDKYVAYLRSRDIYSLGYVKLMGMQPQPAGFHLQCTGLRLPQALMACLIYPNALESYMEFNEYRSFPGLRLLEGEVWTEDYIYQTILPMMMTPVPKKMPLYSGKQAYPYADSARSAGAPPKGPTRTHSKGTKGAFDPNIKFGAMPKPSARPNTPRSFLARIFSSEPATTEHVEKEHVVLREPPKAAKKARNTSTPRENYLNENDNKRTMTDARLDEASSEDSARYGGIPDLEDSARYGGIPPLDDNEPSEEITALAIIDDHGNVGGGQQGDRLYDGNQYDDEYDEQTNTNHLYDGTGYDEELPD